MISALDSNFIIDGIARDLTPRQLLGGSAGEVGRRQIVDETLEPGAAARDFHSSEIDSCLEAVLNSGRVFPLQYSDKYSRFLLAKALVDTIWREGSFGADDLAVSVKWSWNEDGVGNMAAFYRSVEAVTEYADSLGVRILNYDYEVAHTCRLEIEVSLSAHETEDDYYIEQPYRSENPSLGSMTVPSLFEPDPQSWIVYVPFDTADYRLGGSLLAQAYRFGGVGPELGDADYFLDSYEVIRELVEDGVIIAGTTVGDGGLLAALKKMTGAGLGTTAEISDLAAASSENDPVRLLFSEIPGVLFQIRDSDFDYLDAELLLQDIAYYPLGHPVPGAPLRIRNSGKSGIQKILESLIVSQGFEGED